MNDKKLKSLKNVLDEIPTSYTTLIRQFPDFRERIDFKKHQKYITPIQEQKLKALFDIID